MCFVGFEKNLLGEVTSTDHLVPASTPEIEPPGSISGRKQPTTTQMAVNSTLKAPQATRDLGMARVDRRAAWLRGEHAEARTTTARSVSLRAPPFASLKWPSLPSISRPPSLSLEYPGSNARYVKSRYFIITVTHHIATLTFLNPAFFLSQVAGVAQEPRRASSRTRFSSLSSFRGSHHDTMNSNEWPSFPWFSPRHYEHPSRHVRTR